MSERNSLFYRNPNTCHHLADYKLRHGIDGYNSLQSLFKPIQNGKTRIKNYKNQIPRCSFCEDHQGRLFICLICSSISCSSHTLLHTHSNSGHDLAVDIQRSELYCCSCSDQVYDPDFDNVIMSKQIMDLGMASRTGFDLVERRSSKRRRLESGIKSDLSRSKLLLTSRDSRRAKWSFPLGLRGLNNLGSTCFMNSVLQALFHAPAMTDYLLSGQHNSHLCLKRSVDPLCLTCNLDTVFSSMFSGDRTPYSPAQFLYSWWRHSANLATYEQQDSHEFFISLLDAIHENEGKSRSLQKDCDDCDCITHRAFSGLLRSDVTCMSCGSTSTTYDPFIDISLTLDINGLGSFSKGFRRVTGETSDSISIPTLSACLDFFTKSEKLGPDQKLHCENCQERKDSSKQMSIRRLPSVLCLHIKRFEHSISRKASRKIDDYLQFPFHLDMTPYLSSSVLRSRYGNRIFAFDGDNSLDNSSSAEFEIFAVITHSGMLESGHYMTFLRLHGRWYKCDDAWINEVDEDVVRASQCYMLFYVQKKVNQKPFEEPNCLRISSAKDPFLPIAGCC